MTGFAPFIPFEKSSAHFIAGIRAEAVETVSSPKVKSTISGSRSSFI